MSVTAGPAGFLAQPGVGSMSVAIENLRRNWISVLSAAALIAAWEVVA